MAQYVCSICGYVYDEEKEGVKFDSLPENWTCPLCGASKTQFKQKTNENNVKVSVKKQEVATSKLENKPKKDEELTNGELSVICSNLAKGCEKQYLQEEAKLFNEIADYYNANSEPKAPKDLESINKLLNKDLLELYPNAFSEAKADGDRGAQRALTWSEKVSKIVNSLIERYKKEGVTFLANTKIFVCEICGFIYLGDEAPEICPICKVPKLKIHEVGRA